ncbi:MAG: hypothetical protein F6K11_32380 [Leptolyngbya sp. SIO3F4]|nr:hypothetical protein [Leptolyngbya sp. SIO3F4]
METRALKSLELPQLLNLYKHLHSSDAPLPEQAIVDQTWACIQDSQNFQYFGVFDNNNLVSSCHLSIIPNLTRGCRPFGSIENGVTAPTHRQ